MVFKGKANCAQCPVPPLFTEPGWNAHKPSEIGIDDFESNRSPDETYRTAPLRGLFAHMKVMDVVNRYNNFKKLNLTESEKNDLVEYLKSL